jgi:hypothetical protein
VLGYSAVYLSYSAFFGSVSCISRLFFNLPRLYTVVFHYCVLELSYSDLLLSYLCDSDMYTSFSCSFFFICVGKRT